jgi:hypothetical protein
VVTQHTVSVRPSTDSTSFTSAMKPSYGLCIIHSRSSTAPPIAFPALPWGFDDNNRYRDSDLMMRRAREGNGDVSGLVLE